MTDEDVVENDRVVTAGDAVTVAGESVVEDVDALGNAGGAKVLARHRSIHHADADVDVVVDVVVGDLEETIR
ncbi:MAG: hypothetical protein JSV41_01040 [Gemmatimonadota bacterium]|nr:MAG: hypothetical protein JSV41_01040 [Gemmatimonadota bacterium]